jgi:molybdopterin molybdotransferase
VAVLDFPAARACVIEQVTAHRIPPPVEEVALLDACGRVLAADILSDRDYPPAARSLRDGFAVRAADLPGQLRVIGEVRAGERFAGRLGPGEAIEIMTGASLPAGADAVVMVEHVELHGEFMHTGHRPAPGEFINRQGAEARLGDIVVRSGRRLDFADIAMLATVGARCAAVYRRPRVAILSTGDEIVEMDSQPEDYQIRNSNTQSLTAQVLRAGGAPVVLPIARDTRDSTYELVERGLREDLLLLSGGVSAGKYDLVEAVLAEFGAEFFFDRVRIQPGQPLVFGLAGGKFFFGLPGNPASTMVTFEIFARAALDLLGGATAAPLSITDARLNAPFRHKTGLTRFLPAELDGGGGVTPIPWQGSSDVPALARANCFLVVDPDREQWSAGDYIRVMPK